MKELLIKVLKEDKKISDLTNKELAEIYKDTFFIKNEIFKRLNGEGNAK